MKNKLLFLAFFFTVNTSSYGFTVAENYIFYNVKNTYNQQDSSILDLNNARTKAEFRAIRMLAKTTTWLVLATVFTLGFSMIPALILAIVMFAKFRKYYDIFEEMSPDDPNYAFLKKTKKLVTTAFLLALIASVLVFLFFSTEGDFSILEPEFFALIAALIFVLIEWLGFKTNKIIDK